MGKILWKLAVPIYRWTRSNPVFRRIHRSVRSIRYAVTNAVDFGDYSIQEEMLADRARVDTYHQAITRYVQKGDRVVDSGTGTGILAFFAASKEPAQIFALEHGRIIEFARAAAAENGIVNIEFIAGHSKTFEPDEKVDVIIHEQMGSPLFGEYMITNIVDLRDRVLRPGGRILPAKFEWYIEPVQLKDLNTIPFAWERSIHGVSFRLMRDRARELGYSYYHRKITAPMIEHLLCDPEPVLRIDLEQVKMDELPHRISYRRKATRSGRLDGFCCYFRAIFDDDIVLSTDPFSETKTSHWPLRLLRVEGREYQPGATIEFTIDMEDIESPDTYRWW